MIYERDCKSRFMLLCDLLALPHDKWKFECGKLNRNVAKCIIVLFFSVAKLYFFKLGINGLNFAILCQINIISALSPHSMHPDQPNHNWETWIMAWTRSTVNKRGAIDNFRGKERLLANPNNEKYFKTVRSRRRTWLAYFRGNSFVASVHVALELSRYLKSDYNLLIEG